MTVERKSGRFSRFPWLVGIVSLFTLFMVAAMGVYGPARSAETTVVQGTVQTQEGEPVEGSYVILTGLPEKAVSTSKPLIDQVNQTFTPHVLVTWVGKEVTFKNSEMTAHNVRLVREGRQLMNKFTMANQSVTYTFKKPGVVDVLCDIHPSMHAFVLVQEKPSIGIRTNEQGTFRIEVPRSLKETYPLRVWQEKRGVVIERELNLGESTSQPVELTLPSS